MAQLYTTIAMNYYASGRMAVARSYVWWAAKREPGAVVTNGAIGYTFAKSMLGAQLWA
jgi:hypothetical protein